MEEEKVVSEIDALVTEMHLELTREESEFIGVAYARLSTDFKHSIDLRSV